jgi:hypothetical protein
MGLCIWGWIANLFVMVLKRDRRTLPPPLPLGLPNLSSCWEGLGEVSLRRLFKTLMKEESASASCVWLRWWKMRVRARLTCESTASNQDNRGLGAELQKGLVSSPTASNFLWWTKYFSACLQKEKVVVVLGLMRGRESGEAERAKFYPP